MCQITKVDFRQSLWLIVFFTLIVAVFVAAFSTELTCRIINRIGYVASLSQTFCHKRPLQWTTSKKNMPLYFCLYITIIALPISSIWFLYRLTAFRLADNCHGNAPLTLEHGSVIFEFCDSRNLISEQNSVSISRSQLKLSPFSYSFMLVSPNLMYLVLLST